MKKDFDINAVMKELIKKHEQDMKEWEIFFSEWEEKRKKTDQELAKAKENFEKTCSEATRYFEKYL